MHPLHSLYLHVVFHDIYKSPLWFSSELPVYNFEPQHLSTDIYTVSLLYTSKTSQSVTLKEKLNILIFTTSF